MKVSPFQTNTKNTQNTHQKRENQVTYVTKAPVKQGSLPLTSFHSLSFHSFIIMSKIFFSGRKTSPTFSFSTELADDINVELPANEALVKMMKKRKLKS